MLLKVEAALRETCGRGRQRKDEKIQSRWRTWPFMDGIRGPKDQEIGGTDSRN